MIEEYPKMPTVKIGRGITNLIWKAGHVNAGAYVVFQNAQEERSFVQSDAVPAVTAHHIQHHNDAWRHAGERTKGII
jgi:hypothetical protein